MVNYVLSRVVSSNLDFSIIINLSIIKRWSELVLIFEYDVVWGDIIILFVNNGGMYGWVYAEFNEE